MRVLIACEFSGIVRDAFKARGHDAWSCDLLPSEKSGNHLTGNVIFALDGSNNGNYFDELVGNVKWDMLIAFPPCTHLSVSGARWFKEKQRNGTQDAAIDFFLCFAHCCIPKVAIENPIGIMSTHYRKPDQIIQPWQFGHPESKATCLWLKGLPLLKPTRILPLPKSGRWENQTASGQNKLAPSPDRWKDRSRTYPGIAKAMAEQWT